MNTLMGTSQILSGRLAPTYSQLLKAATTEDLREYHAESPASAHHLRRVDLKAAVRWQPHMHVPRECWLSAHKQSVNSKRCCAVLSTPFFTSGEQAELRVALSASTRRVRL
jgi:hypothetical protein